MLNQMRQRIMMMMQSGQRPQWWGQGMWRNGGGRPRPVAQPGQPAASPWMSGIWNQQAGTGMIPNMGMGAALNGLGSTNRGSTAINLSEVSDNPLSLGQPHAWQLSNPNSTNRGATAKPVSDY